VEALAQVTSLIQTNSPMALSIASKDLGFQNSGGKLGRRTHNKTKDKVSAYGLNFGYHRFIKRPVPPMNHGHAENLDDPRVRRTQGQRDLLLEDEWSLVWRQRDPKTIRSRPVTSSATATTH